MMCFRILTFFLFSLISCVYCALVKGNTLHENEILKSNDTLIFAHVIYRHGDRNIDKIYPNDPWKDESHWPGGIGGLTNKGKMRQYELGKYFRKRYDSLLGDRYSADKVFIQSTDIGRTIMSALANVAGLFPPNQDEIWKNDLNWQPIPVHTVPYDLDGVLYAEKPCPKYQAAFEKYLNESPGVKRIFAEHSELFAFLTEKSGKNIKTITDVYWLHNTLRIEKEHNKTLAEWAEKILEPNGTMEYIATYDFKTYADTPITARLKSGFLLKEILEHFSQKVNSTLKPDRSIWFYSAHDITISNMLNSLGLYELHEPKYASSLHFELYKTEEIEHFIQIFYRNSEEEDLSPMHIPKCGKKCPLNQFYAIYNDIIPGDFDSECRLS